MRRPGGYLWNIVGGVAAGLLLAAVVRPGSVGSASAAATIEEWSAGPDWAELTAEHPGPPAGTAEELISPHPVAILHPRPPSPPSLGALASRVYVRARPEPDSPEVGVLALGAVVRLRRPEPVSHERCQGGWFAVEPEGYVCHDEFTTLDVDRHPLLRAKRRHRGDFSRPSPFAWGKSLGTAPLYRRLPTVSEQRGSEPALERHLERIREARAEPAQRHRSLLGVDLGGAGEPVPEFLAGRSLSPWALVHTPGDERARYRTIPRRSTVAWTDEFTFEERSWVLTEDLLVVPKDRLVNLEPSPFVGVHLDASQPLPLAFVRGRERPQFALRPQLEGPPPPRPSTSLVDEPLTALVEHAAYAVRLAAARSDAPLRFVATGESWPRLGHVLLTGVELVEAGERYLETRGGSWIRAHDAAVVRRVEPRGIPVGEKWIDVSIASGTLVAYAGEQPVFATLISPGANGYRRVDGQPAKWTTPTGTFRIEWKHRSTTMSPDPDRSTYYLSEVPYTQFFHLPYALHAAYWHDRFGEPKSGGCVNLSVTDARWLFDWTEPRVPPGWHGVRSGGDRGAGTWVRVR